MQELKELKGIGRGEKIPTGPRDRWVWLPASTAEPKYR